jgi:hypothetical protein
MISVILTQGSVGKTTIAANRGGIMADAGLRVLLSLPPIFIHARQRYSVERQKIGERRCLMISSPRR